MTIKYLIDLPGYYTCALYISTLQIYTSKKEEMITTFVDPLVLALKPTIAMGNVLVAEIPSDTGNNTTQDLLAASIVDLSLTPSKNTAKVGETVKVTIEGKNQQGSLTSGKVLIASSVPVGIPSEKQLNNGTGELDVTSSEGQNIELTVSTEDGSSGTKGIVTDLLTGFLEDLSPVEQKRLSLYGCGPLPMLHALSEFAHARNLPCQVSLESRMACGVGACLGCSIPIRSDGSRLPAYQRACKEGPVFDSSVILWDDPHLSAPGG